jgi:broad specificity phosphatase PhoE
MIREPGNLPEAQAFVSPVRGDGRRPGFHQGPAPSLFWGRLFYFGVPLKKMSNVKKPPFHAHSYWSSEPATVLVLVRHGETNWNIQRKIQGWKGTSLNALGLRQARLVSARLEKMGLKPDGVLVSDLKRALQTAQIIAKRLGVSVTRWKEWRERSFGDWEGRNIEQILSKYRLGKQVRVDPFMAFDPKGGESMPVFEKRVTHALERVEKEHAGKTMVIVTHGGPVRIAACIATGIPAKKYFLLGRPGNTAVTVIQSQGGTRWLESYNDTAHLEKRT